MTGSVSYLGMLDVFVDSLLDSLRVLAFVFLFHFLLSFFEGKIAKFLEGKNKAAPVLGSAFGLIPECGTSVVASDLYLKGHLTIGTLIAVFLACSDEALPILFSDDGGRWYVGFVVLGLKFLIGAVVGVIVDLVFAKANKAVEHHLHDCEGESEVHHGCCGHEVEEPNPWKAHLVHPLIHSLKIFVYVFVITFLFGIMVYYLGEERIESFLSANYYLSPLLGTAVGLIPNCAASVLLSTFYLDSSLPFAGLFAGLLMNAGLGMYMLFKSKKSLKKALLVLAICLVCSIGFGYCLLPLSI